MTKYKDFIKSIGIILITNAFLYFFTKLSPITPHLITEEFKFPLIKEFIYIYNSWYPFVIIISLIIYLKDKNTYKKLIYSLIIGIILTDITYIIYPTIIERPIIEVNNITDFILNLTYKVDTPAQNCMPSAHCLFCFILIYYIIITKNLRIKHKIFITIYFILIILSTLFTKQHLFIDVITALLYTTFSLLITYYLYTKKVSKNKS